MSNRNIPQDIKNTVLELIIDFKDNIFTKHEEKGDLMIVEFFFQKLNPDVIAERIVMHVLPYSKAIEARDITFFLEKKNEIFAGLPAERVIYFSELIQKEEGRGGMSEENKNVVWAYFDTLKALGEKYKKNK
jgi:hypothetical protein